MTLSAPTPSTQDEWSKKLAELLRSMPAELREPAQLRGVLTGALREMSVPVPVAAEAPATPVHAGLVAQDVATPTIPPALNDAPAEQLGLDPSDSPNWVAALRQQPKIPSLTKVGSVLNQPLRMARHLVETGEFDTQAFRAAYGNGWTPSNREFGRQFADEIARCTAHQIAEGAPWVQTTHHALVGLTALSAPVLTNGIHALMNRLTHSADAKEAVSQSVAATLKDVLLDLPSGHPAFHEESGMIVRAQMLDVLAQRQKLEATMEVSVSASPPLHHLRRTVR